MRSFFTAHPELDATPLHRRPDLARRLGIAEVLLKDETARFGLTAFKGAGAAFAVAALRGSGDVRPGDTLACASEGNHGRAVAHVARRNGCRAVVYMGEHASPARIEAIRGEDAEVVLIPGGYDEAVRVMARDAAAHGWTVISDTSWPGYSTIPRLIALGYTRLLDEHWGDVAPAGAAEPPEVIFVPAGVGGLLAAVASWNAWRFGAARPRVVAVEPVEAACVLESVRHGKPTALAGPFDTTMAGLRCGEMSPDVFPAVSTCVDAFIGLEDDVVFEAMRALARPEDGSPAVRAGASGAAALAGLMATLSAPALAPVRRRLGLGPTTRALALVTEGPTDPALFAQVLARD